MPLSSIFSLSSFGVYRATSRACCEIPDLLLHPASKPGFSLQDAVRLLKKGLDLRVGGVHRQQRLEAVEKLVESFIVESGVVWCYLGHLLFGGRHEIYLVFGVQFRPFFFLSTGLQAMLV